MTAASRVPLLVKSKGRIPSRISVEPRTKPLNGAFCVPIRSKLASNGSFSCFSRDHFARFVLAGPRTKRSVPSASDKTKNHEGEKEKIQEVRVGVSSSSYKPRSIGRTSDVLILSYGGLILSYGVLILRYGVLLTGTIDERAVIHFTRDDSDLNH